MIDINDDFGETQEENFEDNNLEEFKEEDADEEQINSAETDLDDQALGDAYYPDNPSAPGTWQSFDPDQAGDGIVGDPFADMQYWQQQTFSDSCAVVAQSMVMESLTDESFSEQELCQEAYQCGWYTPGGGTPMDQVGNVLSNHGIEVQSNTGCNLEDIREQLNQNHKVIVGIDADEIWTPGYDEDDYINSFYGIPGQDANHAVEVIGIDESNPEQPFVILNDPGTAQGQGMMVPLGTFTDAWEDSRYFMVNTTGNVTDNVGSNPHFGSSYHYEDAWHNDWTYYPDGSYKLN